MIRLLAVLITGLALIACATQRKDVATHKDTKKSDFLFEKSLGQDKECIAAFQSGDLLYLISRTRVGGSGKYTLYAHHVSVYDPRTGLMATVAIQSYGDVNCSNIPFQQTRTDTFAKVYFVASPDFRSIFDQFRDNPGALENAIDAGPPYYRRTYKWSGQITFISLDNHVVRETRSVNDLVNYLTAFSVGHAKLVIEKRLDDIRVHEEKTRKQIEKYRQKQDTALARWTTRLKNTYKIGDKVCTYDTNLFGYFEGTSGQKIKVRVIGRPLPEDMRAGFFFSPYDGRFQYRRFESIRWFERGEIAPCNFND